jgi:rod shape-determining protein MreD
VTLFQTWAIASISPNLLIILTSAFGFMRGRKEGMWVGFFCGLLRDIFFGDIIGVFALMYACLGYLNGFFHKRFFPDEVRLPILLISATDLAYGILIYLFFFFLRGRLNIAFYFLRIMFPELIYTIFITVFLYYPILKINQGLESKEKRSASKFG